jgi:hypothetical protein
LRARLRSLRLSLILACSDKLVWRVGVVGDEPGVIWWKLIEARQTADGPIGVVLVARVLLPGEQLAAPGTFVPVIAWWCSLGLETSSQPVTATILDTLTWKTTKGATLPAYPMQSTP